MYWCVLHVCVTQDFQKFVVRHKGSVDELKDKDLRPEVLKKERSRDVE